jgi:hypothetical protein
MMQSEVVCRNGKAASGWCELIICEYNVVPPSSTLLLLLNDENFAARSAKAGSDEN